MTYRCLKQCDGRQRGLLSDWETWLKAADRTYTRFLDQVGDSPFLSHEVAAVGHLASAATVAGFAALHEYALRKRGRDDKRMKVDGRADMWFRAGARAYSFEFKRASLAATRKNLSDKLSQAYSDARCIGRDEYHYAAGGVIARVDEEHRLDIYEKFADEWDVDFACSIGPQGKDGAFLYFQLVR